MNQPASAPAKIKAAAQPASPRDEEKVPGYLNEVLKVALATCGATVVAYFAYRLARRKDDRSNFLTAATTFRQSFAAEIVSIENFSSTNIEPVCDILVEAFSRHRLAVENFRPLLKGDDLKRLNATWQAHCYDDEPLEERNAWGLFLHFTRDAHGGKLEVAKAAAINSLRKLQSCAMSDGGDR